MPRGALGVREGRGFSLVELVVVMAIVAVVAGIVVPVQIKARAKALQTGCAINLAQIGRALLMYAGDYDECFPGRRQVCELGATRLETTWHVLIFPYVRRWEIYLCPANEGYFTAAGVHSGFGLNACVVGDTVGRMLSRIDLPAQRIMGKDSDCCGTQSAVCQCKGMSMSQVFPHNGGANCLYADGHIKWHREAALRLGWRMFDLRVPP